MLSAGSLLDVLTRPAAVEKLTLALHSQVFTQIFISADFEWKEHSPITRLLEYFFPAVAVLACGRGAVGRGG